MDPESAKEVVSWKYESPYEDYGLEQSDLDYLLEVQNNFFAGYCNSKLIGFISFGSDGRVSGGSYDEDYLDIGVGLEPESAGKGIGQDFLQQGIILGSGLFNPRSFRVTVAAFNKRAQKVCHRLGFIRKELFLRTSDQKEFVILTLESFVAEPIAGGDATG